MPSIHVLHLILLVNYFQLIIWSKENDANGEVQNINDAQGLAEHAVYHFFKGMFELKNILKISITCAFFLLLFMIVCFAYVL